jgi:hypothetical protein
MDSIFLTFPKRDTKQVIRLLKNESPGTQLLKGSLMHSQNSFVIFTFAKDQE